MKYQKELDGYLQEWLARLANTGHEVYSQELGFALEWIEQQPALRAIVREALSRPEVESVEAFTDRVRRSQQLTWPSRISRMDRAALIWRVLVRWAEQADEPWQFGLLLTQETSADALVRFSTQRVVAPLFDYLSDRMGPYTNAIHVLGRCRSRIEWFDRVELYEQYSADTRRGEAVYDAYVRRFIFDQGMDMPWSQAKSASGLSDVVVEAQSGQLLVCEIKVFDGANRGVRGLANGLTQSVQYARDHGQVSAQLFIINLAGRPLQMPTDGPEELPPHLAVGNVVVHFFDVRAWPEDSASRQKKLMPIVVDRASLLGRG